MLFRVRTQYGHKGAWNMVDRITDKLVRGLEPPKTGNRIVYDSEIKGFGVRVTAAEAVSYVLNYRLNGRERRYTIGGANEWTVQAARKRAGELRRMIARGDDPMTVRVDAREAPTVADLCDRFETDRLPRKRPSTKADYQSIIKNVIRPKLGNRKVADVRRPDVDKLHRDMADTPYRANRSLALLSSMFSFAIGLEWRVDNPCKGVERFPEEKRKKYLKPEEIKRLTDALAKYEDQKAANVVRLCLLTGCRRGEALGARWEQFDLKDGEWTKPGATTKQKTEHRVPLSAAAIALLKDILTSAPKNDDGEPKSKFVFPGRSDDAPLSEIKDEWAAIRKAAKIPDVRLHDLRHTFASILASAGQSLPIIGALLGHTNPQTTARYAHLFNDPLKKATDTVGHIVTGGKSAEVVNHPKVGGAA